MNYKGMEMPLKKPPSEYAKRHCYYGASFPSKAELAGIDEIGEDHVLWGNDYPHYEGTFPYNLESLRLTFAACRTRAGERCWAERCGALQLRPRGAEGSGGKSRPDARRKWRRLCRAKKFRVTARAISSGTRCRRHPERWRCPPASG